MNRSLRRNFGWFGHWLTLAMFGTWWGGFTFYAAVVVPTGHHVLHSRIRQGFITQEVTNWLNLLGAVVLVMVLVGFIVDRQHPASPRGGRVAITAWCLMAATLAILVWMHPHLDGMLDPVSRSVSDDDRFYAWHRWYLIIAALQWLAGAVYLGGNVPSPRWLPAGNHR